MNDATPNEITLAHDMLAGAKAFADFTGFSVRRCFYLLEKGHLPGAKLGSGWIGSKQAVRERLAQVVNRQDA